MQNKRNTQLFCFQWFFFFNCSELDFVYSVNSHVFLGSHLSALTATAICYVHLNAFLNVFFFFSFLPSVC